MSEKLRSVTIKMSPVMFEQILTIAEKKGYTISETMRYLLKKGMDERIYEENTELLSQVVREQMEDVLLSFFSAGPGQNPHRPAAGYLKAVDPRRLTICRKIV
jgi:hypothetical protein